LQATCQLIEKRNASLFDVVMGQAQHKDALVGSKRCAVRESTANSVPISI
jgi:hypothetical protein